MKKQNTIIAGLLGKYLGELPDAVVPQPTETWATSQGVVESFHPTPRPAPIVKVQDGVEASTLDVECYSNYFLILAKSCLTGQIRKWQISPNRTLDVQSLWTFLRNNLVIGFNSKEYDLPMIQLALKGYTTAQLKAASDQIISQGMTAREFEKVHNLSKHGWNTIDLVNIAPLKASLKLYSGRLHCQRMQDLPYEPGLALSQETAAEVETYCGNDLNNTLLLLEELLQQVQLRQHMSREYGIDLRSRSDAQMAEYIIAGEVKKINGVYPGRPTIPAGTAYKYKVPSYIEYKSPALRAMLEAVRGADFLVGDAGQIVAPAVLSGDVPKELWNVDNENMLETPPVHKGSEIKIGAGKYRMGIGGLHSSETCVSHYADEEHVLLDDDVASYYPNIILTQGLYPQHMGEAFLTVYRKLVTERLAAKKKAGVAKKRVAELKKQLKGLDNA